MYNHHLLAHQWGHRLHCHGQDHALSRPSGNQSPEADRTPWPCRSGSASASKPRRDLLTQLGQLPLSFIPNQGQINAEDVHYHLRSLGGNLYFKPDAVILALPLPQTAVNRDETWPDEAPAARPQTTLRLQFEGANPQPTISPLDALPGKVNYFMGDDPNQWQTDIPTYKGVLYEALYPGIDLQYDGHEGLLKGTFIVALG